MSQTSRAFGLTAEFISFDEPKRNGTKEKGSPRRGSHLACQYARIFRLAIHGSVGKRRTSCAPPFGSTNDVMVERWRGGSTAKTAMPYCPWQRRDQACSGKTRMQARLLLSELPACIRGCGCGCGCGCRGRCLAVSVASAAALAAEIAPVDTHMWRNAGYCAKEFYCAEFVRSLPSLISNKSRQTPSVCLLHRGPRISKPQLNLCD